VSRVGMRFFANDDDLLDDIQSGFVIALRRRAAGWRVGNVGSDLFVGDDVADDAVGAGEPSRARLKVMRETTDGFRIAEEDLKQRGPGDVLGTRQTGEAAFRVADLARDAHLLPAVQRAGEVLMREHPDLVARLIARWIGHAARFAGA